MHQIRFRLGLCPDFAGELITFPQTLSWILRVPLLREKKRKEREEEEKERKTKGQKREEPCLNCEKSARRVEFFDCQSPTKICDVNRMYIAYS